MNKIYTKKDKLIIEIPLVSERYNPYISEKYNSHTPDTDLSEKMDNVVGLIADNKNWDVLEMGFAYNIDMSYKGKDDQETDFFYKYHGSQEDFIKLCEKLKIEVREIYY